MIKLLIKTISLFLISISLCLSAPEYKMYSEGTGFFINYKGDIATAAHVINGTSKVYIVYDGRLVRAEVLGKNKKKDVAILHVNILNAGALMLGSAEDKTRIYVLGFPDISKFGTYLHITSGVLVNSLSKSNPYYDLYSDYGKNVSCEGNSGGPVIDLQGNVIGILTVGYGIGQQECSTHAGAIDLEGLRELAIAVGVELEGNKDLQYKPEYEMLYDIQTSQAVVFIAGEIS